MSGTVQHPPIPQGKDQDTLGYTSLGSTIPRWFAGYYPPSAPLNRTPPYRVNEEGNMNNEHEVCAP